MFNTRVSDMLVHTILRKTIYQYFFSSYYYIRTLYENQEVEMKIFQLVYTKTIRYVV